jgi:hypothetical protein
MVAAETMKQNEPGVTMGEPVRSRGHYPVQHVPMKCRGIDAVFQDFNPGGGIGRRSASSAAKNKKQCRNGDCPEEWFAHKRCG